MNKSLLIPVIFFICSFSLTARTCTSGNGVYNSWLTAAWSCTAAPVGGPPICSDNMIVNGTIRVSEDVDYSACPGPIVLTINGNLEFNTNGVRFKLPTGSTVVLSTGATISKTFSGGGSSTLISIGGGNVWTAGDGTFTGPMVLGAPLPIELVSFTAEICDRDVCLNWITSSETNNDYFSIEKTSDGFSYENLATVDGAGNSSSMLHYSYTDFHPFNGTSYYRLKQTDYNGHYSYSLLKAVEYKSSSMFSFEVYPNPNNGENISLAIEGESEEEVLVVVTDITGKNLYSKVLVKETAQENVFAMDPSNKLPAGIYLITATSKQALINKKLIVN